MTPEQKQRCEAVADIGRFAAEEATKRIVKITSVLGDDQEKLAAGLRASKSIFLAYLTTCVSIGMPVCDGLGVIEQFLDDFNRNVNSLAEAKEE